MMTTRQHHVIKTILQGIQLLGFAIIHKSRPASAAMTKFCHLLRPASFARVVASEDTMSKFLRTVFVLVAGGLAGYSYFSAATAQTGASAHLDAMKSMYRREPPLPIANQPLVDLGRDLFLDPAISASGKTACVTCHLPQLGWAVTDAKSKNDSGKLTSRRSQPLIGMARIGTTPVGWDGRNPTLEAQAKSSIATGSMSMSATPTPVKVEVIAERIRANPAYVAKFKAALPGAPIDIDTIVQAVAAFERTLDPGIAPFDRWIEGDETAISDAAKRGFELYNGKALCFTCHRGWRFTDDLFHDIGTTTTDRGRGAVVKDDPSMQFAFKTPTLRDVALRPPYMHNASQATLDAVMRHYEKGGIDRPSRSPLMQPIALTDQERQDLIAFMETLTSTIRESAAVPK
jgi:cytochrome c peroxidase